MGGVRGWTDCEFKLNVTATNLMKVFGKGYRETLFSKRVSLIPSVCIIVEISLNEDNGSTLVARAGGQVAE